MKRIVHGGKGKAPLGRLEQALEHVTTNWLPPNSKNLESIQSKLRQGQYLDPSVQLVEDLKNDLGLFSHCIRFLKEKGIDGENPVALLAANAERVGEHLALLRESSVSQHNFKSMDKSQAVAAKNAILSVNSSEMMAQHAGVPSDIAFSCSALRQVSLGLISWNFPRIYSKAVESAKSGRENVEAALARSLGFHPRVLAGAIGTRLGYDEAITIPTGTIAPTSLDKLDLGAICEAGELFAALHTPEISAGSAPRFHELEQQVVQLMGADGFDVLREHCTSKLSSIISVDPVLFQIEEVTAETIKNNNLDSKGVNDFTSDLFKQNSYVQRCPEDLQVLFKAVYQFLSAGQASPRGLQVLVSLLVPRAGFSRGCVFLADDLTRSLVPKLRIGTEPLSRFASSGNTREAMSMLGETLMCSTPIRERNVVMFGQLVSFISGTIGSSRRVGVLYLELSEALSQRPDDEALAIFKAIRKCLGDCLAVGT